MKTKFLFLFLLLLSGRYAFSAIPKFSDTATQPKVAHWNEQQFFDAYGTNDTARALIQYYFKRNKKAKRDMLIWGTAGIAAAVAFDRLENGAPNSDATTEVLLAIVLLTVSYLGIITILFSSYYWIHFSR